MRSQFFIEDNEDARLPVIQSAGCGMLIGEKNYYQTS